MTTQSPALLIHGPLTLLEGNAVTSMWQHLLLWLWAVTEAKKKLSLDPSILPKHPETRVKKSIESM